MRTISEWNEEIIAEFRANQGRVRWSNADDLAAGRPLPPPLPGFGATPPIVLVHTIGAKSGRERVNPLMYQPVGDDFAVFATYGGSPRHPAWFTNLMANPRVTVETGTQTMSITARVAEGQERERVWSAQVAAMPKFAEFAVDAGRQIPVVILRPDH